MISCSTYAVLLAIAIKTSRYPISIGMRGVSCWQQDDHSSHKTHKPTRHINPQDSIAKKTQISADFIQRCDFYSPFKLWRVNLVRLLMTLRGRPEYRTVCMWWRVTLMCFCTIYDTALQHKKIEKAASFSLVSTPTTTTTPPSFFAFSFYTLEWPRQQSHFKGWRERIFWFKWRIISAALYYCSPATGCLRSLGEEVVDLDSFISPRHVLEK